MRLVISPQVFCIDTLCKRKLDPDRSCSSCGRKGTKHRHQVSCWFTGAGALSAVWPGTGTVVGYNAADLAISLFFIGPLADRYMSCCHPRVSYGRAFGLCIFQLLSTQISTERVHARDWVNELTADRWGSWFTTFID